MSVIIDGAQLVRAALEASGLPATRFATLVVWRDARTVRRWLAGGPMPALVRRRLAWFLSLSLTQRAAYVAAAQQTPGSTTLLCGLCESEAPEAT